MNYRDYLRLCSLPAQGIDISLDEQMDLDAIRVYSLLKCLAVPDQIIDLGQISHHLNTQWHIHNLQKTLIKLELYRYISIDYKLNNRIIQIYHHSIDIIQLYRLNNQYVNFVQNYDFEYSDQLYAHQCAITLLDYLASVQPDGIKNTETLDAPHGAENNSVSIAPHGAENTEANLISHGIKNTEALDAPHGAENNSVSIAPHGAENTEANLISHGSKNNAAITPDSLPQDEFGAGDSLGSQDSVLHSCESSGFTHPFLNKLEIMTPENSTEINQKQTNSLILNKNQKNLSRGIDKINFQLNNTTDLNQLVCQSVSNNYKKTNLPTHPLTSISSTGRYSNHPDHSSDRQKPAPRIEDYHYAIDDLDWYDLSLSLSRFIFESLKDHKIIQSDAQRIINVINHYHQTQQTIHSYQALLLKLIKASKNNTLFDPLKVRASQPQPARKNPKSRRNELIAHAVTCQALAEEYEDEVVQDYLQQYGLCWDGTRLKFVEDPQ